MYRWPNPVFSQQIDAWPSAQAFFSDEPVPDSACFLCHSGMDRHIDARSASAMVSKYMKLAGIPAKHRAFHALRRTFGTRLLKNEVSFELIQQLLGHRDMDSMKPYLSIDEQGLKLCALPLLYKGKAGD